MTYKAFDLTGKVALVTGGNRGIGLGMAMAMAQAGANIAIWGTNEANNAEAVAKLSGEPALRHRPGRSMWPMKTPWTPPLSKPFQPSGALTACLPMPASASWPAHFRK